MALWFEQWSFRSFTGSITGSTCFRVPPAWSHLPCHPGLGRWSGARAWAEDLSKPPYPCLSQGRRPRGSEHRRRIMISVVGIRKKKALLFPRDRLKKAGCAHWLTTLWCSFSSLYRSHSQSRLCHRPILIMKSGGVQLPPLKIWVKER